MERTTSKRCATAQRCAALRAEGWRGELPNHEWVRRRHATSANPANSAAAAAWMYGLVTAELESERDMEASVHGRLRIFDLEQSVVDIKKMDT